MLGVRVLSADFYHPGRVNKEKWHEQKGKSAIQREQWSLLLAKVTNIDLMREYDDKSENSNFKLVQDALVDLASTNHSATLAVSREYYKVYKGLSCAGSLGSWVGSELASTTTEAAKSFQLTNFESVSFEDIQDMAVDVAHVTEASNSTKLDEFCAEAKQALSKSTQSMSIVGDRVLSKVVREISKSTLGRDESAPFHIRLDSDSVQDDVRLASNVNTKHSLAVFDSMINLAPVLQDKSDQVRKRAWKGKIGLKLIGGSAAVVQALDAMQLTSAAKSGIINNKYEDVSFSQPKEFGNLKMHQSKFVSDFKNLLCLTKEAEEDAKAAGDDSDIKSCITTAKSYRPAGPHCHKRPPH